MEGTACFNPTTNCDTGTLTLPILEYTHDKGACSVIGGYVYRGRTIPPLQGTYFYADFCAGLSAASVFEWDRRPTNRLAVTRQLPDLKFLDRMALGALSDHADRYSVPNRPKLEMLSMVPNG